MRIYEWAHVDRWGVAYTIQVIESTTEIARIKAINHLEQENGNKYLLKKVSNNKPMIYDKGIQTIVDYPHEGSEIYTY